MQIYLPIAEISVNAAMILALGGGVGFLSGLFGVGGGFLMTPLLIFTGVPPLVAVATGANQIVASSVSGTVTHWRRKTVDFKMGLILLAGGLVGSLVGVQVMAALRAAGQAELAISLSYVVFLGTIGGLMLMESLRALQRSRTGQTLSVTRRRHTWVHGLPLRMRFHRSSLYISAIPPLMIGVCVGLLVSVMGVGGGFIMVPAMIYILGMPTSVVVGTSLFQITFVTAFSTLMHAVQNKSVDVVLAILLIVGGVIGTQIGVRAGTRLKGEQLRAMLALLVLAVCLRMAVDLVVTPDDPFSLVVGERR